ncbi:MAG: Dabb family protein [Phycisphaerales bacterium JB065]
MIRTPLIALTLGAACGAGGCASTGSPARPAVINHPVFITLNDPAQADELIADCDNRLSRIPGIVSYYCGRPFDSGRTTVNGDYTVGLYVGFASAEDYAAYVTHPDHLWLLKKWGPRTAELRVHDIIDETP